MKKTNKRFNLMSFEFKDCRYPNKEINGYDFTENTDGYMNINGIDTYYNFKFIVGEGGAQTRSLREAYHVVNAQIQFILKNNINMLFINIFDGDESNNNILKFKFLLNLQKNKIQKFIFAGDLKEYVINYTKIHNFDYNSLNMLWHIL